MAIKYKDMAVEFKKLNDKLEKAPLTPEELKMVDNVEAYIDKIIIEKFKGGEVSITLSIPNFEYNIGIMKVSDLPSARQSLMRKELDKRYKQAGWKITLHIDDGLDGPNMSGGDYWILSGK